MRLDSKPLTFVELDAALARCMAAHPPSGVELALHPDASRMADLWAQMFLSREDVCEWVSVDTRVAKAFESWSEGSG